MVASTCWSDLLRKLNLRLTGGNHQNIRAWVSHYDLDASHFKRVPWSKGLNSSSDARILLSAKSRSYINSDLFKENAPPYSSTRLKRRFVSAGYAENKCKVCGITSWLGEPLTLHLDHINGIHNDNRVENLQILCPNCHQQTKTWGNKAGYAKGERADLGSVVGFFPFVGSNPTPVSVCACGRRKTKRSRSCKSCLYFQRRKVDRPSLAALLEEIEATSMAAVARKYGVTVSSVKRWLVSHY